MFEKKYVPEVNYDSMFGEEVLRSLERIEELNDDGTKIDRNIELNTMGFDSDMSNAKRELKFMKGELTKLKDKVMMIKKHFTSIVGDLRLSATGEDFDRLKRRVDDFDFQNFITREDFMKLISQK